MFKKPCRKRNIRQRDGAGEEEKKREEEDEEEEEARLADVKEMQKARQRSAGLSAAELALGSAADKSAASVDDKDTVATVAGGLIDLKALKKGRLKQSSIEENLKGNFSKETSLRDEDEEMRKYVEAEIARRKGIIDDAPPKERPMSSRDKAWEEKLYALPENLKKYQSERREEMMSQQMLVGIPEVSLGLETKIRNIEETEAAKLKLLKEAEDKKRSVEEATTFRQDLARDLAEDYVQHRHFLISRTTDLGSLKPGSKKGLEEIMEESLNGEPLRLADEGVPYMMSEKWEGDLDDVQKKYLIGNEFANVGGGYWPGGSQL